MLTTDEGEELIQQAKARRAEVTVGSQPVSPYVYDLVQSYHNEIPSRTTVTGSSKNLARVDVSFESPGAGLEGGEFRYDWLTDRTYTLGDLMPEPVKGKRTDWVSATGDYRWNQQAFARSVLLEIGPKIAYRRAASRPRPGSSLCSVPT